MVLPSGSIHDYGPPTPRPAPHHGLCGGQGGFYCFSDQDCLSRSMTDLGSSK
jgi:hypothetical protein